jgi:predicted ATPase/DNA-binding CsgD family transcriptional regulator/Tfp pilus assembly protein PilF
MTTGVAISAGNLPAEPNSFIGREQELAELTRLLGEVRAVTLCGPGGIGKTRLALRLACTLVPGFPDGAWLVELGDTTDPALVPRRMAAVLGISEEPGRTLTETLAGALRSRRMVLIIDTCEHVLDACAALVRRLLAGCPSLRLIATSRQPLRVPGEAAWRVPPLALPAQLAGLSDGDLAGHEAIRLFAERAAAVRPGFALGTDNIAAAVRLCRALDGIPLAIELAAARVRALSVEQIARGDRFRLLVSGDRTAPPRQQTLRATVDWSYQLLTAPEQVLLRRLSVFAGWNLDMAERVCADGEISAAAVLGLLAALIDKSLVTLDAEVDGTARYRLLDTIREYAAGRLAASGEAVAVRIRHREYLLNLVESVAAVAFLRGDPPWPDRVAMYRRVHAERANFEAALTVSLERGEAAEGLRLCSALRSSWVAYGDVSAGAGWLDRFLALAAAVRPAIIARARICRAELAFEQQDYATAGQAARAGIELCRSSGGAGEPAGHRVLALVSLRAGRPDEALSRAETAIAAARAAGDAWEEGMAQTTRAAVLARQGRLNEARRAYEIALDVLRDNNGWGVAQTLYGLGALARARRDHVAALQHYGEALALYRAIDARPEIARCLAGIGWVALSRGDLELASSSLSESMRLSLATGQRLSIARSLEALAALALARGDPAGARTTEAAWITSTRAGAGFAGPPPVPRGGDESALTRRQLQVAALVARGLSNRAIADELVISPATAARHMANIFTRLGFSSRAQVAAWAAARESGK